MKTLSELKAEYLKIKLLEKSDLQDEIDTIVSKTIQSEIELMLDGSDTPETDIDSLSFDNLVISEDDIFQGIIEDKIAEIAFEIDELITAEQKRVGYKINVDVIDFKFVYEYENFRSGNSQKVYNHYLKRNNRVSSWSENMVRKNRDVFSKQKELLTKFVDFDIKASTAIILRRYNFIDSGFKTLLDKLYFALTSEDYTPLYYGDEIRHGINWLQKERA